MHWNHRLRITRNSKFCNVTGQCIQWESTKETAIIISYRMSLKVTHEGKAEVKDSFKNSEPEGRKIMKKQEEVIRRFRETGIIPVIVLDKAEDAKGLGEALLKGGLPAAEVTFRTEAAAEAIRVMGKEYPELLVGAGTVLNVEQAERAADAGAEFIVSPGLNPDVVRWCMENGMSVIPGTQTPTDMNEAVNLGLSVVKFFPAEAAGGLPMLRAVAAAYTGLSFMPTGGIDETNVREYLKYDRIIACGGSFMVKKDLISGGRFDEIERMVREAAEIVKEIRG